MCQNVLFGKKFSKILNNFNIKIGIQPINNDLIEQIDKIKNDMRKIILRNLISLEFTNIINVVLVKRIGILIQEIKRTRLGNEIQIIGDRF